MKFLLLGCLFAGARGLKQKDKDYTVIVNGELVNQASQDYSFFAMPTQSTGSAQWLGCGASIVSSSHAVSAAHCFGGGLSPCSGPMNLTLWLGDLELHSDFRISQRSGSGMQSAQINATVRCHDQWDGHCSHGHDIVIMDLHGSLPSWVQPIQLSVGSRPSPGSSLLILGYGDKEASVQPAGATTPRVGSPSAHLRKGTIYMWDSASLTNNSNCNQVYAGGYGCSDADSEGTATNIDMQFCAGNSAHVDSCSGDSGSPVLVNDPSSSSYVQVGIVSYGGGPETTADNECGDPAWPGIYSSISGLSAFICGSNGIPNYPGCLAAGR